MKKRIHIFGGPGSGKSTYAGRLALRLALPSYGLDDLYWDRTTGRYGTRADISQRDKRLMEIVKQDGWIVEGVYYAWLSPSFKTADAIIVLTANVWLRHYRLLQRFMVRKRDSTELKQESVGDLWRLMHWNHCYDSEQLPRAVELVNALGREVIRCKRWHDVCRTTETLFSS